MPDLRGGWQRRDSVPWRTMGCYRALVLALVVVGCQYQAPAAGDVDSDAPAQPDGPPPPDTSQPACGDADGDTVCDEDDTCPGSDDKADTDGDGLADGCDDWPCGSLPAAPSATVTVGNTTWGATLSNVNFGGSTRVVAAKNADVSLSFDYAIHDSSCPGNCIDQIEVGIITGKRQKCPFDQAVQKNQNVTGSRTTTLRVPTTSGLHTVRYGLGQNFSCTANNANDWWQGEPPDAHTIAIVCVP